MQKCNLNKVALQLYLSQTFPLIFSCKFTAYFQSTYITKHLETKIKLIRVTQVVLVSITLLLYTFRVEGNVHSIYFLSLFFLHFYWFSHYPRINIVISIEKYLGVYLELNDYIFKAVSLSFISLFPIFHF